MLRNHKFCTFGRDKREKKKSLNEIGPDKYNPSINLIKQKNPEWSFGNSKRSNQKENNIPGPGQYQINPNYSKKMGKIGKDKRTVVDKNQTPGPGTYNNESLFVENLKKKKGTSLYSKNCKKNEGDYKPSPFHYESPGVFEENIKKKRGFTISKSVRNRVKEETKMLPGPGQYEFEDSGKNKTFKGGKFPKEERNEMGCKKVPGPGSYYLASTITKDAPKYSFGKAEREKKQNTNLNNTAPFFYDTNVDSTKSNAPKFSFSKQLRNTCVNANTLGPGSYDVGLQKDKKGGVFGKEKKMTKNEADKNLPGPGAYEKNSTVVLKNNLGNFLSSKNFKKDPTKFVNSLGPGHYDPKIDITKKRPASCKFGKSKGGFYKVNDTPGCGTYNIKDDILHKKYPQIKFGSENNRAVYGNNHIPGPGQYEFKSDIEKKNKFTFGMKYAKSEKGDSPGPGKYNANSNFNSLKPNVNINGKFSKETKLKSETKNNTPAPGEYFKNDTNNNKGKNIVFGKEKKIQSISKDQKNPDFYNLKTCFEENIEKKKGPSITFKQKPLSSTLNNPGPGTYDVTIDKTKNIFLSTQKNPQKCFFAKDKRFNDQSNVINQDVGPGKYETIKNVDCKKNNSFLPKNIRFKDKVDSNPGPGDYNIISTFGDIPKYIKDQIKFKITL